jgi:alpha-D-xyloside xylohydrolase
MRLIPYLYAAFARYRFDGTPPFRALVTEDPSDRSLHGVDDAFMVGDNLLAAPLLAGETSKTVRLPKGGWYCYWTKQRYEGGQTYELAADLDTFPLFVKENTLLPLAEPVLSIQPDTVFDVTVHVFGDGEARFELFEDDGASGAFEQGAFNRVVLDWDGAQGAVERTGDYDGRTFNICRWVIETGSFRK